MDTARIAAFVAAADAGSLSAASGRLGVPLSTLSRHIADLERELGAALLDRTGRGVRLTSAGARFVERGRAILREIELGTAELRDASADDLLLSAPPDVAHAVMPEVFACLAVDHPDVGLQLRADRRQVSLLEEGYDAAIRMGPLAPSELVATRIGTVSVCVCGPHELAGEDVAGLARQPWVMVGGIADAPGAFAFPTPGRLRMGTFGEAAEVAARLGRPVALPAFVAASYLQAGRLVPLLGGRVVRTAEVRLVRRPSRRGSAVLADLVDHTRAALARAEAVIGGASE